MAEEAKSVDGYSTSEQTRNRTCLPGGCHGDNPGSHRKDTAYSRSFTCSDGGSIRVSGAAFGATNKFQDSDCWLVWR